MFKIFTDMSPLLLFMGIFFAVTTSTIVFHIGMALSDRYKLKHGLVEDMSKHNTAMVKYYKIPRTKFRIITGNLLLIISGIMLILTINKLMTYGEYGAFLDDSWRKKDVEEHFVFTVYDDDKLTELYNSNPDDFNFECWKIVMVRFGCPDCEKLSETIKQYQDDGYMVIFSRSEIGKKFMEYYEIDYVPTVITDNKISYLRVNGSDEIEDSKTDVDTIIDLKDQLTNN